MNTEWIFQSFKSHNHQRTGVQGMEAESGQITVKPSGYTTHCEWRTWWIQQDIRELQFGQDGKPMSLEDRDRSNFHSVPDVAVSTFSPKVTQDTTVLDPHKQTFHGSLNLPYENEKTREPDITEFIHTDSHFPSYCPSSFSLNSKLMYDVLFFHLKMPQLNTCMVTMATIR